MTIQIVDMPPPKPSTPGMATADPIVETVENNQFETRQPGAGKGEIYGDRRSERMLPDVVKERIAKMAERDKALKTKDAPAAEPEAAVAETAAPTEEIKPEVAAKVEVPPPVADEWRSRAERLEEANRKLVAELEKRPTAVSPHKTLTEAQDSYVEDELMAVRRFIAASIGVSDPADKRIDAELKDLYTSLTASELSVTPDDNYLTKRRAVRTQLAWEREKRERQAEKEQSATSDESRRADETAAFIGNRLTAQRSEGKTFANEYPLLMGFAERLDGMKPEKLLHKVLEREIKTGRIAMTQDDDAMIAQAAKIVESQYQDLADKFSQAKPPSTAQPKQPKAPSPSNEVRQEPATRTLTAADASVAPATPPAQKTETAKDSRPKFKSDKERREWALRRIPT